MVKYIKRETRETKKGLKYSYRFYVQDVRITSKNLENHLIINEFNKMKNMICLFMIKNKNEIHP